MLRIAVFFFALLSALHAHADEVQVAVAANFMEPMKKIALEFEKESGHKAILTSGATGRFYAQIRNGAPFEMLFAADSETPAKLEHDGLAVADSRFTYAIGRLVLWSAKPDSVDARGVVLKKGGFAHLAIANPRLAPYGAAAVETLKGMNLLEEMQPRFVQGENIAQTFQFASSGNAELGFVAMSQVYKDGKLKSGSAWIVPAGLHTPILQDALILKKGQGKPAAESLMRFMKSDWAREVIRQYGYSLKAKND
ncbi:MAG: modA [Paucimonas sp.]|jgi:molybdate transport system substrate-binding protein|nr:modA [Paucimonas sp.]